MESIQTEYQAYRSKRSSYILIAAWTFAVGLSLSWDLYEMRVHHSNVMLSQARGIVFNDLEYRLWNAGHGGVYVPITEKTPPNPYLSHIPERDITTTSGKKLTLVNPAYMVRQKNELKSKFSNDILGHITSLKLKRPENRPDTWETDALKAFEKGETEVSSIEEMHGDRLYFRYMQRLLVEKSCLKCHEYQGYKIGDVRGGLSVSIPFDSKWVALQKNYYPVIAGHSLLWFLGFSGLLFATRIQLRTERKTDKYMQGLNEAQKISHIGSWELDLVKNKLEWSDEIYRIFEIDQNKVDASYEAFLDATHPDDREFVNTAYKESLENRKPYDIVHRLQMADGRVKHVKEHCKSTYAPDGTPLISIGTVQDITPQVESEKALHKSLELVQTSLEETIAAISKAIEARDPYTAGHQRRVAKLSTAIALEMELNEHQIEGIHMGATIHDIGKISMPAEILSKPTKLTELEYSMIQTHSEKGWEILKDIKFPWPVADIAHQHHEHINGGGYPQGLKGDEICIEARIVTVADVVEAMVSDRPYRAGLGVEAALNEIQINRGIKFDEHAVDACLTLFKEKGFTF
ncbi:MAG: HD domain-containing phosphohydrolase [Mariprofundaceae bacterium]